MEFLSIAVPRSEAELTVMVSLLVAHEIPHYVHNQGFGGLYPGMQVPLYNTRRIMVPEAWFEDAAQLLAALRDGDGDAARLPPRDRMRVVAEGLLGGWPVPFPRQKPSPGPAPDDTGPGPDPSA